MARLRSMGWLRGHCRQRNYISDRVHHRLRIEIAFRNGTWIPVLLARGALTIGALPLIYKKVI